MSIAVWVIGFSLVGGVFSLIGGVFLLAKQKWTERYAFHVVGFAAGVLLTVSFLEILPEAVELSGEVHRVLMLSLLGMMSFFFLERFFIWFHHHHELHVAPPTVFMLLVGDTLHNFLDGVVIAAAFLVNIPLGVMSALAIAAHEIPQEVADFGIMLSLGIERKRVFWLNFVSALATLLGAGVALAGVRLVLEYQAFLLAFAGGMFCYIAAADLIPELHRKVKKEEVWGQSVTFLIGSGFVWVLGAILGH